MKKSIIFVFAASMLLLSSCNDFLDKSPRDTFTNTPAFWSNTNDVASYSNKFYDNYTGYSSSGSSGWFYFTNLNDDQATSAFKDWTFKTIPDTSSNWSGPFTEIRRVNYMLQGLQNAQLSQKDIMYYTAVGRLNRAWQYYQLVRKYGDVEWINYPILNPEDELVYGKRTDRDVVMDSVLNDLNFAIANLSPVSDKTQWSAEMATAMKSDICLYEGTFCKYRTQADNGKAPDAARAQKYLQESVTASEALMKSGLFSLSAKYGDIYNSLSLGTNKEIIFYRNYEKDVVMHSIIDYTCGSTEQSGLTKDAIDAFLFRDGKPLATTSMNKDDKAVINKDGNYSIATILNNRDPRLSVLIDSIICFKGHSWARLNDKGQASGSALMTSSTGYTIKKFDNTTLDVYYRTNIGTGYTDAPLYWYAVILLNEAEAKAELNSITQTDLDNTVNLLQKRVGLPNLTLQPLADPNKNMNVSDLLWEIRRVRRCELMLDNWYRYWDLVRWHQLDKLDSGVNPAVNLGANLTNVANNKTTVNADNYIVPTSKVRQFDHKYYVYPIPSNELNLNTSIQQNANWAN